MTHALPAARIASTPRAQLVAILRDALEVYMLDLPPAAGYEISAGPEADLIRVYLPDDAGDYRAATLVITDGETTA